MRTCALLCLTLALPSFALAEDKTPPANVQLPLSQYDQMVDKARAPKDPKRPAPARYAFGHAQLHLEVNDAGARSSAHVTLQLSLRVLEAGWVAVPLLANGTAVSSAKVAGRAVELISTGAGLAWTTDDAGSYEVELEYDVDAQHFAQGHSLALPVPEAPSLSLTAVLPGKGLDVAVIPAAALTTHEDGDSTTVEATISSTRGLQLSWRLPGEHGYSVSRARYRGVLDGNAVRFEAQLAVELFEDPNMLVPLFPTDVTLSELLIDGKPGTIVAEDDTFHARVARRGTHQLKLSFELPVVRDDGPPHVELKLPEVPVSDLEITLPGDKEVKLDPVANVSAARRGRTTVSHAFLPMTDHVQVSWAEAVPAAASEELLANANIFHLVHAEEGVLYVRAMVVYEVTSGHSNVLELEVPADVQVSDIRAADGGIRKAIKKRSDGRGAIDHYSVFLDRELEGELSFDVFYERKLSAAGSADALTIPLIRATQVSRQRGMIALLASKELTLKPDEASEQTLTRVGENQLPPFVREAVVDKTIAHTYKYLEDPPKLLVRPAPPERKQGKFDAQIDTLISLGDATLKGSASVEIHVKSGSLEGLTLRLPAGVNLLELSAPSLRTHALTDGAPSGQQLVDVQFTQQMEGQFRVEVSYEKITSEAEAKLVVPTLNVVGAEVEQGRIAVEALSAVEVGEAAREHLSPLDPNELPQQLVLKTTNPILRAYKYVQIEPPYSLALKVERHKEVEVQNAAIDKAYYRTLYTRDGLAVTTASFSVRNSREQFLKIKLPKGSKVWSAFVAERAEKPAIEQAAGEEPVVLIKIINSTDGFPVELVYETKVAQIGALGRISGHLPTPDMVVTHSEWDVYLPEGMRYGDPDSNMTSGARGEAIGQDALRSVLAARKGAVVAEPLRIEVPTSSVRFSFSKIYANRSSEPASFSVPYNSTGGAWLARLLALLGVALFWSGLAMLVLRPARNRTAALTTLVAGALLTATALGSFGVGLALPLLTSLACIAGLGLRMLLANRPRNATA